MDRYPYPYIYIVSYDDLHFEMYLQLCVLLLRNFEHAGAFAVGFYFSITCIMSPPLLTILLMLISF